MSIILKSYHDVRMKYIPRETRFSKKMIERMKNRIISFAWMNGVITLPRIIMDSLIALINQQTFISGNFSANILIVFYLIAMFNLIFGYFLNLVSVDVVAIQPVDTIDTLSDLLDHERFKNFDVFTIGGVWHEEALKSARINSPENQLWKRIPNENYIYTNYIPTNLGPEIIDHILSHLNDVVNGSAVTVVDRQAIPVLRAELCHLCPYLDYHRHHMSKDWFGERLLVPMISTGSDEKLISWIRYKYRQIFQSSLLQSLVQRSISG